VNYKEERPWGEFENLLDAEYCKVKRIIVNPHQRLSYQYHFKRSEVWTVVSGIGLITINDKSWDIAKGQTIEIPAETRHRIENKTDEKLIFIEVQHGSYFGEDDIVRIQDDYNR
jgi:mannose-6-phosphate isomerase-like protein (cupin superfamily)